jgi:hypothetical protein
VKQRKKLIVKQKKNHKVIQKRNHMMRPNKVKLNLVMKDQQVTKQFQVVE